MLVVPVLRRLAPGVLSVALACGTVAVGPASVAAPASPVAAVSAVGAVGADVDRQPAAAKRVKPGKYEGHFYTSEGKRLESFTFRVARDGRTLKKFYAALGVICSYYPPTVEVHPMGFPAVKINRQRRFHKVWQPNEDTKILLQGTFRGKRLISGKLDYTVGVCVRVGYLKARRVGP